MFRYRGLAALLRRWRHPSHVCAVAASLAAILVIALVDWVVQPNVSLGALYFLPLLALAAYLSRAQLVAACVVCAVLREVFGPYTLGAESIPRFLLVLTAYTGSALFVNQVIRSRREAIRMRDRIAEEAELRRAREAELRSILNGIPVGVLVLDRGGRPVFVNRTAQRLLSLPETAAGSSDAPSIVESIPGLAHFLQTPPPGDTSLTVELPVWRLDGQQFLARLWVTGCGESRDPSLAVAFTDISEQVREAHVAGLENLITGSRVVLGAVSHEIRNLAAAIGVEIRNIARSAAADVGPLLALAAGLEQLAAIQLQTVRPQFDARTDLARALNEIAAIMKDEFSSAGVALGIELPEREMWARVDCHGLLQVLLNLTQNALREASASAGRSCQIAAARAGQRLVIRICNSGDPVAHPERLFHPFGADAEGTGLGLYVSRSILRSYGGDLRYDTEAERPCFTIELVACPKAAV